MFKSLLVPLDGSEYSERALATALELARVTSAEITVLTVVLAYKDVHAPWSSRPREEAHERAEAYLKPFLDSARAFGFKISGRVAYGDPADEIPKVASRDQVDLIVISTHGMGGDGRSRLGGVALKVLQSAQCPVMLVRIAEASQALTA